MEQPVTQEELKEYLKIGKVYFEYTKVDGTKRQAWGTLKNEFIPSYTPPTSVVDVSTGHIVRNYTNLRYYDLDRCGWRSVSGSTSLIMVI
jgi:hypothetical protein